MGLTQQDVQAAGGPSTATLRVLERGVPQEYRAATIEPLEDVLRWERGSVERILAGGRAVELVSGKPTAPDHMPGFSQSSTARRHKAIREMDYLELFDEWCSHALRSLEVEMEYARRRNFGGNIGAARDELWATLMEAGQIKDGHPWQPPWELEDDEQDEESDGDAASTKHAGDAGDLTQHQSQSTGDAP